MEVFRYTLFVNVELGGEGSPNKCDLICGAVTAAELCIAEGNVDATPVTMSTFREFLHELVEEGGPTPQVGASASRSLETHWLVGGMLVSLIVDFEGNWLLWCEDSCGCEFLESEGGSGTGLSPHVAGRVRQVLREMGLNVAHRTPSS